MGYIGFASLKVILTDMTDDPRALCFRVSPAIWFVTFPAKRARRRCAFRTANVKEKSTSSRMAVRDALAQMRGADSIDEGEQTRCASRRHAPVQPSPPAPADGPVELSHVSEKGLGERKSKSLRGFTVAGSIAGRMMSICR